MDAASAAHPIEKTLQSYGLGQLDAAAAGSVHGHLESCPDCRRRVAELSSDRSLHRLREAQPDSLRPAVSSTDGLSMLASGPVTPAPPPASTLPPGLADHPAYEILRELGRGGMGVVYLAQNTLMGRLEVLKVVGGHLVSRPAVLERFLREIRSAARLNHTNIVTAYSAIRLGEGLVLAMEYVEGLDLARLVKARGPLPVANACNYVHQAALGLQHAHEHGMVHRDIKPANLILARAGGRGNKAIVKVLDFGLAKVTSQRQRDSDLTREGQMLGTPDYIAPEQIRDAQSADIRADIYSLGCTLYYLLSGKPPFRGDNLWDVYQAHFSMDAAPLNLARPEVPVELAALVAKMMAKEPERRFQEPREVAQALSPFFKKGDVGAGASRVETSQVGQGAATQAGPRRPTAAPPGRPAPDLAPVLPPPLIAPAETTRAVPESETRIAFDGVGRSTKSAAGTAAPPRRRPPWVWPAIVAASVLGALAMGVIIYMATDHGRITIVEKDADAVVRIDGQEILIKTPRESIALRAGRHEMAVTWRDGQSMTREFVIRRGESRDLRVEFEPKAGHGPRIASPAAPPPPVGNPEGGAADSSARPRSDLGQRPAPPAAGNPEPRSNPESIGNLEETVPGTLAMPEQGFTPLFNGRELTGWTAFSNSKKVDPYTIARVSRGEIILVPSGGNGGGLRTNRSYRDFTLKLEYLFPVGGILNKPGSGVIILPESGAGLSYQQGIQFQIRTGESGDLWTFAGASLAGQERRGQLGKVARKLDAEKTPGQWNAVVIRCEGSRITFELNGREVNRSESHPSISGWIGLMNQGSAIHFRNIEIRELSPSPKGPARPPAPASQPWSVVGKWRHAANAPNANKGVVIDLAADGSILNARGAKTGTWSLRGSTLVLRWPNKQAPGGAWLDTVVLGPNRKRYNGKNQGGVVIHGARVEE